MISRNVYTFKWYFCTTVWQEPLTPLTLSILSLFISPALMQSCTALSGRLYRRPCFLFILVAVAVSVTYTTFALNWWNDPQRPSVISHTGKTPDDDRTNHTGKIADDDQVNPRVLTNRNGVQWEDPGRYHVAYPRGYKFIMDEPEKCRTGNQAPFLVLMAPVAPGNPTGNFTQD